MKTLKLTLMAGMAASALSISAPSHAQAGTEYIGQVSAFGFNFCPRGWGRADGTLLPISQNTALFSILGTTYGGDGRTTFGLPDLRGRHAVSDGTGPGLSTLRLGQRGGTQQFTLTVANLPSHTHTGTVRAARSNADSPAAANNSFATSEAGNVYLDGDPATNNMHPDIVRMNNAGGNQSVFKVSPYLGVTYCVALFGVFPSRS